MVHLNMMDVVDAMEDSLHEVVVNRQVNHVDACLDYHCWLRMNHDDNWDRSRNR